MLGFIRRQPLPHQLSAGTLVAVVFFMTLLIYFISRFFTAEVNSVASENQNKQVELVSQNLEARFDAMVANNQLMSRISYADFNDLSVSNKSFLMANGRSAPEVWLGDMLVNQDNSKLIEFTQKSDHFVREHANKSLS